MFCLMCLKVSPLVEETVVYLLCLSEQVIGIVMDNEMELDLILD